MDPKLAAIFEAVLEGDMPGAKATIQAALDAGLAPNAILNDGMIAAMAEVGRRFEEGDYYVPEMLISARAMQAGLAILKPHLQSGGDQPAGTVLIGTVKGDLHDIGKNLVALMLEGAGFEVRDLGVDVSADKIVEAIRTGGANILALSALLTTTMPYMKTTINAIRQAGLRDTIKIMVGGAPVNAEYASQIGADGYSPDASRAVRLAHTLMGA